jgi:hypothetical protein
MWKEAVEEIHPSSLRIRCEWKQRSDVCDGNYALKMGLDLKERSHQESLWILKKQRKEETR